MTYTDSVFKADSGTSPEKKPVVADPKKDVVDPHHDETTENHQDDHSTIATTKLADVHESTWGGSAWNMLKSGYDAITGFVKPEKADQTVADIENLQFTDDIFKSGVTTKPDATVAAANQPADSGISGWFSKMGDAVAGVGKEVTGHVTSAMDWLFATTDSNGNKTEVSAKNGEAHINGKNPDGVPVDVHVGQHKIEGDVGAAKVMLDKDTKEGHYTSGAYDVTVKDGVKTVVDGATHEEFQWDERTQKGFIADKDGKHLFDFTSKDQLTQRLTSEAAITQTNTHADATADAVKRQMDSGTAQRETRYIVDKDGNYAVVRKDGLMIKTYKNEGFVTIEKDGHMVKIQNNQAFVQEENPETHKKEWVAMRGHHHDALPPGMVVDANTGAVAVDGKTVVTASGNVQADAGTHIDTKTGKMTTQSDTGVVTVDNSTGKTHVRHNGCGDIVNDGHSFRNMDPKTQHTFSGWNTDTGVITAFGGENGSGISLDTRVGGNLTIREASGQVTQMSNTGYFNSVDAQGKSLMSVDSSGNATFYDGTTVGADGTVSNQYGSGSAWDGGSSATAAVAQASGAVGAALAASSQFDPNGSTLGMLDAADSELSSLAQTYAAMGRLDLVGQLSSAQGQVADARGRISQVIAVSDDSRRLLGDGSSSRVHEALNSGSPETYLLNQMADKNYTDEKTTAA